MAETGASPAPRSQPPDRRERPLRRDPAAGIVGGVLAGIAAQLGWDVRLVRVLFLVGVVVTGGLLLAAYAVGWLLIPAAQAGGRAAPVPIPGRRRGWQLGLGVGLLTTSGLLVFRELGLWWSDAVVWPLVLAVAGATLLWAQSRRADATAAAGPCRWHRARSGRRPTEAAPAAALTSASRLRDLYRGGFGVALVVGAALLFLSQVDALGAARDAAFTAIVAIFALALILAPFIWRLGRSLAAERAERVRSQERAEMAAHLHDSVLQTLTLMQMRADDPREVAALARRQQRELRAWLAAGREAGEDRFAAALRAAAEEVEDAYRINGRRRRGRRRRPRRAGGGARRRDPRGADQRRQVRRRGRAGLGLCGGRAGADRGVRARPRPRLRSRPVAGGPPRGRASRSSAGCGGTAGLRRSSPCPGPEPRSCSRSRGDADERSRFDRHRRRPRAVPERRSLRGRGAGRRRRRGRLGRGGGPGDRGDSVPTSSSSTSTCPAAAGSR